MRQIHKIYLSNFMTGLVFWYGIEKLFMKSIGISAYQVGILTAIFIAETMLLDIPGGMLADAWSRKKTLVLSAIFLALCTLTLGYSASFWPYVLGYMFYGLYIVTTEGVYQALTYDSLHELGLHESYSKVQGRAHALFLTGAGVANIASGYIAKHFGFRATFMLTLASCLINIVVIMSLSEPKYHKASDDKNLASHLLSAARSLFKIRILRVLAIISSLVTLIEYFKSDFGQLYMLRYVSSPQAIGVLWAVYAFTWAFGSFIAHRMHRHLTLMIALSTAPIFAMAFLDKWPALILFNIQSIASAVMFNQIETRVQQASPSNVRASILSALSTMGRIISVPAVVVIGWIINHKGAFVTVQWLALVALVSLLYWLYYLWSEYFSQKQPTS